MQKMPHIAECVQWKECTEHNLKRETAVKINYKLGDIIVQLQNRTMLSPITESEGQMHRDIKERVEEIRRILLANIEKDNST